MNDLAVLPFMIPMLSAVACMLAWKHTRVQRMICVGGAAAHLIACIWLLARVLEHGIIATSPGDWPVPFGIVFVIDTLSAILLVLTGLMGTAVAIYTLADIEDGKVAHGFCPLFHMLIMGVSGAFTTGDIFNLYVQFEIMLTASFVLLALGGGKRQMIGGIKYVTLNLVASAMFLAGVGVLYGLVGTLNLADISAALEASPHDGLEAVVGTMLIVAFGMKAAAFPMFFWLPAAYHAPPPAVSALFSGLLTKVGLYSLIRMFTLIFTGDMGWTHGLMLGLAAITMVVGVLGAIAQSEMRRLLSFQIVSHIGYILMGLGLMFALAGATGEGEPSEAVTAGVALGLTGAIVYMIHHIVTATNLFLISGIIERVGGSGYMKRLGGLSRTAPLLGIVFMVSSLALAGVPPFSGFWAKVALVKAGLSLEQGLVVAAALLAGVLTLYAMMVAWAEAFWRERPDDAGDPPKAMSRRESMMRFGPILGLTAAILVIGLLPGPFFSVAERAADELLDPSQYRTAVMSLESGYEIEFEMTPLNEPSSAEPGDEVAAVGDDEMAPDTILAMDPAMSRLLADLAIAGEVLP